MNKTTTNDIGYMERALELALKGRGFTKTNPIVGCVIVKNDRVIAEGWHESYGGPHAEANALKRAGKKAKGAELFVTLEPCSYYPGKKTPACVESIINEGIKRCVIAMKDPNPKVSGRSIRLMRKKGIKVEVGLLSSIAEAGNEAFLKIINEGRPLVISKMALTLDGKAATYTGDSKWISNEKSRTLVHYQRSLVDAVMVGVGTVQKDNPMLNVRMVKSRNPLKIIMDPECRIPLGSKVLKEPKNVLVVVNALAERSRVKKLLNKGVRVISVAGKKGSLSISEALKALPVFGVSSVLMEGGPTLLTAALKEKVVDKIMWFIAPKILGADGKSVVGNLNFKKIKYAIQIKDPVYSSMSGDLLVEGKL